jgi:hypothetical protein
MRPSRHSEPRWSRRNSLISFSPKLFEQTCSPGTLAEMPCAAPVEVQADGYVAPIIANAEELARRRSVLARPGKLRCRHVLIYLGGTAIQAA